MGLSYKQRWGYGGKETALNGCTALIHKALDPDGNADQRYEFCLNLIIQFARENNIEIPKQGKLITKADKVAKKIQKDFRPFRQYIYNIKKQKREYEERIITAEGVANSGSAAMS